MKKALGQILLMALLAALVSLVVVRAAGTPKETTMAVKTESTYERIMRTRTIRCGYFLLPPHLSKDPNTGKMSGIYADFMDALATVTDLKIEWVQEMNFGTYLQDLADGRYDMECAGGWPNAKRGQVVFYGKPYAYIPYVALVRPDDRRFDNDPTAINNAQIKVATMDGETSSVLRRLRFPLTQDISIPQTAPISDLYLGVSFGKADITFTDALSASMYVNNNPGKLRIINHNPPLYLIAISPTFPPDERLKEMVDIATDQLLNTGVVDQILRKYDTKDAPLLRAAMPFRNP
ncbi:MAG: amino acid ABC transporter substrate-binding protein [Alphaproteobacteria bacterium]|nr:amino acid ABC transporter substrate-binding protein [Alphaproteobacteria bacterium]